MPRAIAILDYGAGNLTSIRLAFERLGASPVVTSDPDEALRADALVFPGVGSAKSAMDGLLAHGLDRPLRAFVAARRPVLAICLGMQMVLDRSEEDGGVPGLGFTHGAVRRFRFDTEPTNRTSGHPDNASEGDREAGPRLKVPLMGWVPVRFPVPHPVSDGLDGEAFYFVHSYRADLIPATVGIAEYGGQDFTAALATGSLFATQFHPERSGDAGLRLLSNFLAWSPSPCS